MRNATAGIEGTEIQRRVVAVRILKGAYAPRGSKSATCVRGV
ncbi:hypothetical protein ACMD2_11741 [Ananas comosus]|uniref:Uncharacterized protein n=1 Tax=Ananas comosus TaxID=4615 RepID=A0A199UQ05_ANACO|nr:hypothetical protein ACMD2_11741 [Ananas comosus]